jgi:hypothetical protein
MASIQITHVSDAGVRTRHIQIGRPDFTQMINRLGRKMTKPRTRKQIQADVCKQTVSLVIPDDKWLSHQILIERQSPLFTGYYDDDGVSGYVFSSPGLTKAYVAQFDKINHLRSAA